jgi:hypothetical protein
MTATKRKPKSAAKADTPPDLSHIAEPLRPLAVPLHTLTPDPANARKHPDRNIVAIRGSLAAFGQVKPVVVREATGTVVCGNGTLAAALALGWTHIAAVVKPMDQATATALAIADNRTAELAEWDNGVLDKLLADCVTGNEQVDAMLRELATESNPALVVPDDPADHWQGMPEFEHEDQTSAFRAIVHFANEQHKQAFEALVGQTIPANTNAIWYPKAERQVVRDKGYVADAT